MRSSSSRFETPPSRRFWKYGDGLVVERPASAARDLELQVQFAQQEVGGCDVADERDHHAAAGLLARERQRHRGFALAPEPAEQIDLPGQAGTRSCRSVRGVFVGRPSALVASLAPYVADAIDLRIQERSGDAGARARFLDARDAARRSRLLAIASLISACSAGSSNTSNHGGRPATRPARSSTNRMLGGVGICGRA